MSSSQQPVVLSQSAVEALSSISQMDTSEAAGNLKRRRSQAGSDPGVPVATEEKASTDAQNPPVPKRRKADIASSGAPLPTSSSSSASTPSARVPLAAPPSAPPSTPPVSAAPPAAPPSTPTHIEVPQGQDEEFSAENKGPAPGVPSHELIGHPGPGAVVPAAGGQGAIVRITRFDQLDEPTKQAAMRLYTAYRDVREEGKRMQLVLQAVNWHNDMEKRAMVGIHNLEMRATNAVHEKERMIEKLKGEVAAAEKLRVASISNNAGLMSQLEKQLDDIKSEKKDLQGQLTQVQKESRNWERKYNVANATTRNQKGEIAKLNRNVKSLKASLALKGKASGEATVDRLEDLEKKIESKDEKLLKLATQVDELIDENRRLNDNMAKQAKSATKCKTKLEATRVAAMALRGQLDDESTERRRLEEELEETKTAAAELRTEVRLRDASIDVKDGEIESLKTQKQRCEEKLGKCETELKASEKRENELKIDMARVEAELKSFKERGPITSGNPGDTPEAEMTVSPDEQAVEAARVAGDHAAELKARDEQITELQRKLDDCKEEKRKLSSDKHKKQQLIDRLNSHINYLETEMKSLRKDGDPDDPDNPDPNPNNPKRKRPNPSNQKAVDAARLTVSEANELVQNTLYQHDILTGKMLAIQKDKDECEERLKHLKTFAINAQAAIITCRNLSLNHTDWKRIPDTNFNGGELHQLRSPVRGLNKNLGVFEAVRDGHSGTANGQLRSLISAFEPNSSYERLRTLLTPITNDDALNEGAFDSEGDLITSDPMSHYEGSRVTQENPLLLPLPAFEYQQRVQAMRDSVPKPERLDAVAKRANSIAGASEVKNAETASIGSIFSDTPQSDQATFDAAGAWNAKADVQGTSQWFSVLAESAVAEAIKDVEGVLDDIKFGGEEVKAMELVQPESSRSQHFKKHSQLVYICARFLTAANMGLNAIDNAEMYSTGTRSIHRFSPIMPALFKVAGILLDSRPVFYDKTSVYSGMVLYMNLVSTLSSYGFSALVEDSKVASGAMDVGSTESKPSPAEKAEQEAIAKYAADPLNREVMRSFNLSKKLEVAYDIFGKPVVGIGNMHRRNTYRRLMQMAVFSQKAAEGIVKFLTKDIQVTTVSVLAHPLAAMTLCRGVHSAFTRSNPDRPNITALRSTVGKYMKIQQWNRIFSMTAEQIKADATDTLELWHDIWAAVVTTPSAGVTAQMAISTAPHEVQQQLEATQNKLARAQAAGQQNVQRAQYAIQSLRQRIGYLQQTLDLLQRGRYAAAGSGVIQTTMLPGSATGVGTQSVPNELNHQLVLLVPLQTKIGATDKVLNKQFFYAPVYWSIAQKHRSATDASNSFYMDEKTTDAVKAMTYSELIRMSMWLHSIVVEKHGELIIHVLAATEQTAGKFLKELLISPADAQLTVSDVLPGIDTTHPLMGIHTIRAVVYAPDKPGTPPPFPPAIASLVFVAIEDPLDLGEIRTVSTYIQTLHNSTPALVDLPHDRPAPSLVRYVIVRGIRELSDGFIDSHLVSWIRQLRHALVVDNGFDTLDVNLKHVVEMCFWFRLLSLSRDPYLGAKTKLSNVQNAMRSLAEKLKPRTEQLKRLGQTAQESEVYMDLSQMPPSQPQVFMSSSTEKSDRAQESVDIAADEESGNL